MGKYGILGEMDGDVGQQVDIDIEQVGLCRGVTGREH